MIYLHHLTWSDFAISLVFFSQFHENKTLAIIFEYYSITECMAMKVEFDILLIALDVTYELR